MNTFNLGVTVNFGPETLQAVNRLFDLIKNESAPVKNSVEKVHKVSKVTEEKTNGQETAAAIKVTLEQLREKFTEKGKASKENKLKCKEILDGYSVTSVSNIPADKYAEAYSLVNEL